MRELGYDDDKETRNAVYHHYYLQQMLESLAPNLCHPTDVRMVHLDVNY